MDTPLRSGVDVPMSRALVGPRVSRPINPRRRFALQFLAIAVGGQACASARTPRTDSNLRRSNCEAASIETRSGFQGATLADALQGKVPGLNIVQVGGAGGGGFASIRGSNSLRSGQPLIYLDGIRMTQITSTGLGGGPFSSTVRIRQRGGHRPYRGAPWPRGHDPIWLGCR